MKLRWGWPLFALFFAFLATVCFADDLKILELPGEIRYRVAKEYDKLSSRLAEAIFDKIEDFKIYDYSQESRNVSLRLGRSVFDNHDVFNSYTVVDTIQLPFTLYGWSELISGHTFSLNFGIGGNFVMRDLRQVGRTKLSSLDDLDTKAASIEKTDWMASLTSSAANSTETTDPNDPSNPPYTEIPDHSEANPLYWLDSMNRARFKNLWNMVAFPARMPFKVDWLKRLDDGEIVVYGGSGYVELGPSWGVGKAFEFNGHDDESFNIGASWRYFLAGEFTIAILKENDHMVKLKFHRYLQSGQRANFGAGSTRLDVFDGIAVLHKQVGKFGFQFKPFNLSWSDSGGPILEIGYEFDLSQPEGKEAYESAVLGKLAKADELAAKMDGRETAPVKRLFHKKGKEDVIQNQREAQIFLYSRTRNATQRQSDVKLTLSDGEHKLYTAIAENTFESKWTLGSRQRLVTRTTVDHNQGLLGLVFEGWMENTSTDAEELNNYEDIVEKTLNRGKIFERVPIYAPRDDNDFYSHDRNVEPEIAKTGPSSFYYRMDLDEKMIQSFVNIPEAERWKIMEKVFGVEPGTWGDPTKRFFRKLLVTAGAAVDILLYPFDIHFRGFEKLFIADRAVDEWSDIAKTQDPREYTNKLGKFFSDSVYGPEMMEACSIAVESFKPPFFLTASNYSFGRIVLQEGNFSGVGKTVEEYRRESQIDSPQIGYNVSLTVKTLGVEVLDENRVKVTFELPVKPNYLYFRVAKTGFVEKNEKELVVLNYAQADAGQNTLILDRREKNYRGALAKAFIERGYYKIYFGIGIGGRDWGPVISQSLYYPYAPDDGTPTPEPPPEPSPGPPPDDAPSPLP